ncbi:MAG: MarR family transcriptional regulator [Bacteroidia bacterium]|nr:MarR family transcriptional regulator [Bacteroidia bacterium]
MKLEDEIKQKSFRNPQQKLVINIIYTYNWLTSQMQASFKRSGLTMQQYNVLRILRGQYPNPSPLTLIRDRLLDRQSDVSRLLDRLVTKGWITRENCQEDRRKMDVLISESGLELLSKLDQEVNDLESVLSELDDAEATLLSDLLDKLRG